MAENEQAAAPAAAPPVNPIHAEVSRVKAAHHDAVLNVRLDLERDLHWIDVRPRAIVGVARTLRDDPALDYKMLCDLTCYDHPDQAARFNVIYNLYSVTRNRRLFLRVQVPDGEAVHTLSGVYPSADWAEREVYDLFGVIFEGHPDLRRIVMPDDWQGYPLRKDYPAVGMRPVVLFNDVKDIL